MVIRGTHLNEASVKMRFPMTSVALLALAACGTSIPEGGADSGAGVGFGSYSEYEQRQAAREAELTGGDLPAGAGSSDTDDIVAQTRAALGVGSADPAAPLGGPARQASTANPAPQVAIESGISAENNFDAVSSRRSIEDDAALVAAQRRQYQVAAVEALPGRTETGPNIAAYALGTRHAPGTKLYKRIGLNKDAKFQRNCAAYSGPDLAQIAFLEKGGPERDRLGLDPDGDGFACSWDPRPFRKAAGG